MKTFEITVHGNSGEQRTLKLQGDRAEQKAAGQLIVYNGEEQVGAFINVVSWHDTTAIDAGQPRQPPQD